MTDTYTPIFKARGGNTVFVPHNNLMCNTKSLARRAGRINAQHLRRAGLVYEGRTKKLDMSLKYDRYDIDVEADPDKLPVCPIEGPLYEMDQLRKLTEGEI